MPPMPTRELHKTVGRAAYGKTLFLLCCVGFIEGADMQLLPATFSALETDMGLSPARLGEMSLAQSLLMSATSPLWGWLADRFSRKRLLVYSCAAWCIVTMLLAWSSTIEAMFILRCFHGASLSSLGPVAQSIIADITEPHQRGGAYGWMYFAINVGQITSSLCGTGLANSILLGSIKGWRAVFGFVAVLSALTAVTIDREMGEPPRELQASSEFSLRQTNCIQACVAEMRRARSLTKLRTFNVLAIQGIFGSVPWNAMGFLAMYLQCCGHSDVAAATVVSCMLMGRAVGGVVGGFVGDALALRSPNHGRPLTAELSVLLGIPFTVFLVRAAPHVSAALLACASAMLGFVASWCSTGVNRPILSEIVDPAKRASIVAWMAAAEGSSGALFGAPVVGMLAEQVFGYRKSVSSQVATTVAANNALALSQSLLWGTVPPWIICAAFYSRLHFTYGEDARSVKHSYIHLEDVAAAGPGYT
eukprot:TRINITY_DN80635_c0_g1_i1.p1 TRINITY_DN80635_c0_g1~~TRINITY_DN80635_c0_g1_i1.p1  ORF type:complete len:476 (-),score=73.80 TRINITY_DN80635_c0_g1_i1:44-1471(-)